MLRAGRRLLALAVLLPLLLRCAPPPAPLPGTIEPGSRFAPDTALQRLVDPCPASPGPSWLGGDSATSARLADGRWVWLFGDTLVGTVSDRCPAGEGYCDRSIDDDPDRGMIANSVGMVERASDESWSPMVKFWRTRNGQPAPVFDAANADEILWPLAAAPVGRLLLVAASRHSRETGLLPLGNVFLRVLDPERPPDEWTYTRHPVPNVLAGTEGPALTWATGLVPDGDFVYVVGQRGAGLGSRTVLARVVARDVSAPGWMPAPEYLVRRRGAEEPVWSARFDADALHELAELPGTSEATFGWEEGVGWSTYQILPLTFAIRLYTAPALTGPWRDRGVVYEIPAPWSTARTACSAPEAERGCTEPRYATYAVKAHPELARPGGQVLSYNVNVLSGGWPAAEHAAERVHGFYVPRMISRWP